MAHVTIFARKRLGGAIYQNTETTFTVTVNGINDPPTLDPIADVTSPEDAQLIVTMTGISAGGGEDQLVPMTLTATSSNTALIPNLFQNLNVSFNGVGPLGDLSIRPLANRSGTSTITVTLTDETGLTVVRTFVVTVTPVPDRPLVSQTGALEDTPSFPFTILRNSQDGAEVTHFKLTNITGGTLALIDETPVAAGQFITVAQGAAGLIFMPSPNSTVTGHFTVQASTQRQRCRARRPARHRRRADRFGSGSADRDRRDDARRHADDERTGHHPEPGRRSRRDAVQGPPGQQRHAVPARRPDADHRRRLITAAQGAAGLRFTPFPNFSGSASVVIVGIVDSPVRRAGRRRAGHRHDHRHAGGRHAVDHRRDDDRQRADDVGPRRQPRARWTATKSRFVKVTGITGGQLFQHDGVTPIGEGAFITMAQGPAGLRFTPAADSVTTGQVTIQASTSDTNAGLGGGTATAGITVGPAPSTTTVVTSKSPSDPGELVTFTATVTAPVGTLTGTVQFKADFVAIGSPVTLVNGSRRVLDVDPPAGPDRDLGACTAATRSPRRAPGSSPAASGADAGERHDHVVGQPDTVRQARDDHRVPQVCRRRFTGPVEGGTVTFKEGATTLGVVPVTGGAASFTTSSLTLGTHHLTAEYGGTDGLHAGGRDVRSGHLVPGDDHRSVHDSARGARRAVCADVHAGRRRRHDRVLADGHAAGRTVVRRGDGDAQRHAAGAGQVSDSDHRDAGLRLRRGDGELHAGLGERADGADGRGRRGQPARAAVHARSTAARRPTGALSSFFAFETSFGGGVRVAEGDVNGDGVPDYIAGAGPGPRAGGARL